MIRPITDDDAINLLESLVRIPSLSGQEHNAAAYFVERMQSLGFTAEIDPAGNAVGITGDPSPDAIEIVLLGHIDTVPGNIPVRREGDILHGRGAVDAKGPLCAFVAAASRTALPEGVRLVVVGAVEEECATSKGARHIAATRRPQACIIGEPSHWDGVTLGYKGRLLCEYTITQDTAHTARPEPSVAEAATAFWARASTLDPRPQKQNSTPAGIFHTIQPSLRSINTSSNGLQDQATLTVGWRLPPGVSPHDLESAVRSMVPEHASLNFTGHEFAHQSPRSCPVARALSVAIRATGGTPTPRLKTGTSDMNVVAPIWRCPIAAYGPGDSALDHTPSEHISLREYRRSINVLTHALEVLTTETLARVQPSTID
jgi:LysW-gamma-L-lysine carboxypeptidase